MIRTQFFEHNQSDFIEFKLFHKYWNRDRKQIILPAFAIHQYVARFQITMNDVTRVDEIRCIENLIHNVPFVDIL